MTWYFHHLMIFQGNKMLEIILTNNLFFFSGFDFWDPFKSKYNCTLFWISFHPFINFMHLIVFYCVSYTKQILLYALCSASCFNHWTTKLNETKLLEKKKYYVLSHLTNASLEVKVYEPLLINDKNVFLNWFSIST